MRRARVTRRNTALARLLRPTLLPNGRAAYRGAQQSLLFRDDLVFYFVVGCLRNDFLVNEIVLAPVGSPLDDSIGICAADAGQSVEFFFRSRIDVEQRLSPRDRYGRGRWGWRDKRRGSQKAKSEKEFDCELAHGASSEKRESHTSDFHRS